MIRIDVPRIDVPRNVRKLLSLTIAALALVLLGACSITAPNDDTAPESGFAPESITGYIVSRAFEAIEYGPIGAPDQTFALGPGTRIDETQYLENGKATLHRYTLDGGDGWVGWYRTFPRRWEYRVDAPNVAQVLVFTYDDDGSTPASTLTLTFSDESSGTWEHRAHRLTMSSRGTFTLRDAQPAGVQRSP